MIEQNQINDYMDFLLYAYKRRIEIITVNPSYYPNEDARNFKELALSDYKSIVLSIKNRYPNDVRMIWEYIKRGLWELLIYEDSDGLYYLIPVPTIKAFIIGWGITSIFLNAKKIKEFFYSNDEK